MTQRMFVLAAIGALGYGLTHSSGLSGPGEPSPAASHAGAQAAKVTEKARLETVARPTDNGVSASGSGQVTAFVPGVDLPNPPIAIETWSDELPIDLGDPLDPDEAGAWVPSLADSGPIDIGPDLNADDPWVWESDEVADAPIEIGAFLDAGAPWGY